MQKSTTDELLKRLRSVHSVNALSEYTEDLAKQKSWSSFAEYMTAYLRERKLSESDIIRESQIPRTYAYQILSGQKNPGRDKVLALCIAVHMDYEETQRALTLAGLGKLYPRRKRDSVLIFAIEQGISVQQVNELLFEEGEEILS